LRSKTCAEQLRQPLKQHSGVLRVELAATAILYLLPVAATGTYAGGNKNTPVRMQYKKALPFLEQRY
jgi:hypothetical protein